MDWKKKNGDTVYTEKEVTQIIEKLIEEIPDNCIISDWKGLSRTNAFKHQLRAKWLQGKEE